MRPCYIFDIDGTVADLSHRLPHIQKDPKDWDAFFAAVEDDAPIDHIIDLVRACYDRAPIIFVSGRSDRCREETKDWLSDNVLGKYGLYGLYMRKDGDHRPDHLVKAELLAQLRADGFEPIMAFDDRTQVVEMWRAAGIPCAQVAPGDF